MPEKSDDLFSYPDTFLFCRDQNHWWDEVDALKTTPSSFERRYRCVNCKMIKVEKLDWKGHVYDRQYYPPDYYPISVAVSKDDIRSEYLRRRKVRLREPGSTSNGKSAKQKKSGVSSNGSRSRAKATSRR